MQEVIFSGKIKKLLRLTLLFNNISSNNGVSKKINLDKDKLFRPCKKYHSKNSKIMGLLRKFQSVLPGNLFLVYVKHS